MNNKQIQRVFIVGCPRSGTTLLQSLLAANSQIASFPESKFFYNLISLPENKSRRYTLGLVTPKLRPMLDSFFDEIQRPEMKKQLPKLPLISLYTQRFLTILDTITQEQGKKIWLEKTPEHLHYIKYIEKFVPQSKIIHIVRNGDDVVASLYEVIQNYPETWGWFINKGLDGCIQRWIDDIEITRNHLHKPNHMLVRYEELVENTESILVKICDFLNVEYQAKMLENYKISAKILIRSREKWKSKVSEDIQKSNSDKFRQIFDKKQQNYIQSKLSSVDLKLLENIQFQK